MTTIFRFTSTFTHRGGSLLVALLASLAPVAPAAGQSTAATDARPFTADLGARAGDEIVVSWIDPVAERGGPYVRNEVLQLMSFDGRHIVGKRGHRVVVVDANSIRRLQRRVGTKPASAPAMVAGSAAGFAAGFLLGMTDADPSRGRSAVDAGLTGGVLVGAPLGAIVAWLASRSRGIYEDVDVGGRRVTSAARVSPSGAVGLAISVGTR